MSEKAQRATKHSGMGAIPDAKGVAFRVWARPPGRMVENALQQRFLQLRSKFCHHPTPNVETHEEGADGCPARAKSASGRIQW